jgi:hypothetical protein
MMRLVALCVVAVLAHGLEIDKLNDRVLVLGEGNWDTAVEKYNPLVVKFYAPW